MEDAQFQRLADSVGALLQRIHDQVDELQECLENDNLRSSLTQEVTELREEISHNIEQVKKDVAKLESNAGHLHTRQTKLKAIKNQQQKEIKRFLDECKQLQAKVKQQRQSLQNEEHSKNNVFDNNYNQQLTMEQIEKTDLHNQLLIERNEDIQHLDVESNKLQNLVNQLAVEVDKQEDYLIVVDDHQQKAKDNLIKANVELDEAQDQQRSANKKYCIIAAIIFLGLVAAVLIYFFAIRK